MSTQLTAMAARVGWACTTFDVPVEALPGEVAADFARHQRDTQAQVLMAMADNIAAEMNRGLPTGHRLAFVCERP